MDHYQQYVQTGTLGPEVGPLLLIQIGVKRQPTVDLISELQIQVFHQADHLKRLVSLPIREIKRTMLKVKLLELLFCQILGQILTVQKLIVMQDMISNEGNLR